MKILLTIGFIILVKIILSGNVISKYVLRHNKKIIPNPNLSYGLTNFDILLIKWFIIITILFMVSNYLYKKWKQQNITELSFEKNVLVKK